MLLCSLTVGATSYLVIVVYEPPGLNVKSFIDQFTILFEEKRLQFDKIVLLGDFNISLNVKNDTSKFLNLFFEDFVWSNNTSINVKSNSFITSSDRSFICFSVSSVKNANLNNV